MQLGLRRRRKLPVHGAFLAALALAAAGCSGTTPSASTGTESSAPASSVESTAPEATPTPAPDYPTGAITIIVPWSPGGGADISARLFAEYAANAFGQPVNVVNVEGGSGQTGALQALTSDPDGYTILLDSAGTSTVLAATRTDAPFELDDRVYIAKLTTDNLYYMASTCAPFTTLDEAMQYAKENPSDFAWAAGGAGSAVMFAQLELLHAADVPIDDTKMITFAGGEAPGAEALAACDVDFTVNSATNVGNLIAADKGRLLGVSGTKRGAEYPDAPSAGELGYEGAELSLWQAFAAPVGTPDYVIQAWQDVISQAVEDPDFQAKAQQAKKNLDYQTGADHWDFVQAQYESMLPLAEALGLRGGS